MMDVVSEVPDRLMPITMTWVRGPIRGAGAVHPDGVGGIFRRRAIF
jgi:hypothetical protein